MKWQLIAAILCLLAVTCCAKSALVKELEEKRVMDCTLLSKSFSDCDVVGYAKRMVVFGIPGIIVGALYIVLCPLFCGGRYCCSCCGGSTQNPGFCCPNTSLRGKYTMGDIFRVKFLTLIIAVLGTVGFIWGLAAIGQFSKGLNDIDDEIRNAPDILGREINKLDQELTVTTYSASTGNYSTRKLLSGQLLNETKKQEAEFKEMIQGRVGNYHNEINKAKNGLVIAFILPVIMIGLGLFSAICSVRRGLPMMIVWSLFLFGLIIWLSHAAFAIAYMAIGDGCAEFRGIAKYQESVVAGVMKCEDSQFDEFRRSFKATEIQQAQTTCEGLALLCYDPTLGSADLNRQLYKVYQCPANFGAQCSQSDYTFSKLLTAIENDFYIHPDIEALPNAKALGYTCNATFNGSRCYAESCADYCTTASDLSEQGKRSLEQYLMFLASYQVALTLDDAGAKFSNCDSMLRLLVTPFAPTCNDLENGSHGCRHASGLLGLCTLAGLFVFTWGSKRFIPFSEADKPQGGEDDDAEPAKQAA